MKLFALAAAAALLSAGAHAADTMAGIAVLKPWSRPATAGSTGAGFLTLVNGSKRPLVLTGATSPAAAKVEVHASTTAGGVMRMTRQDRLTVPAGGRAVFAPGGRHLMLVGLKRALRPGDRVSLTLAFEGRRRLETTLVVGDGLGPAAPDHMHH